MVRRLYELALEGNVPAIKLLLDREWPAPSRSDLARADDVPLVIVHVSNGAAMEEIERARARGRKVIGETCPQYLMLTADDLDGMDWEGAKFVCSPPPRDKESQAACWDGIERGVFDLYSSDHCPFRYEDEHGKLNPRGRENFRHIPNGIPGVETRLPILFSEAVNLHPVSIILAVLFFGGLWGFWGVFFAIPLATLIKALVQAWPRGESGFVLANRIGCLKMPDAVTSGSGCVCFAQYDTEVLVAH